jgi:Uma2 family endonuclease
MQWQDVIDNPYLKDLPFKIELNKWGKIEMSPASNSHALWQSRLAQLIRSAIGHGETLMEASIQTADGVRVPDVVWASDEFLTRQNWITPFSCAPEICVEIISPANSRAEMLEKIRLYLEAGASEVWLLDESQNLEIESREGLLSDSRFVPSIAQLIYEMSGR